MRNRGDAYNESQRPLAPSNLRGGANLQWGKWLARMSGQNFLFIKSKRSVLWTDVLLSISEKILQVFSNLTNLCVMKVNAPLPPLILEGELICSEARDGAYLLPRALPWAKGVLAFQAVGAFGSVGLQIRQR